tara:strand:+ start:23982 stop:24761 length:780 start_codon:yes stop_codon:yes gene_type:complete
MNCLCCGEELTGKQKKYCSKKCNDRKYRENNKDLIRDIYKQYYEKNKGKIKEYRAKNKLRQKIYNKQYYSDNKDEINKYNRQYYEDNKEDIKRQQKLYNETNQDRIRIVNKRYRNANKDDIRKSKKIYRENNKDKRNLYEREKRRKDVLYRLNHYIGCGIRKCLKSKNISKNGRHWEDAVGYTIQELKEHLESKFQPGMTWDNHGEWHIDHIVPKSLFKFNGTQDEEFKRCWSLNNLQPLWAKDNLRKNNKMTKKVLSK